MPQPIESVMGALGSPEGRGNVYQPASRKRRAERPINPGVMASQLEEDEAADEHLVAQTLFDLAHAFEGRQGVAG
ncbi:hypothetical protein HaLaN_13657, partial [Haematococcus lacustris]